MAIPGSQQIKKAGTLIGNIATRQAESNLQFVSI